MARINSNTIGSGCYAAKSYREVLQDVERFQGWGGFFAKALYTILHRISGVRISRNYFVVSPEAARGPMKRFVRNLFTNGIDYESVFIVLVAVKAYVMAAEGRPGIYWKVEAGGKCVKRKLRWVDLTKLKGVDAARDAQIEAFKNSGFYERLKIWLQEGLERESPMVFPNWVKLYEGNDFYHEVINWMEAHGMLEFEVKEKPAPPVISPPVAPPPAPPQGPAQRDLFGFFKAPLPPKK